MSVLWSIPFRQVALRCNQLQADSATLLQLNYTATSIGQGELGDRAIEFPFEAINDALLNAGDVLVNLMGLDPHCPYRTFFNDVTGSLASGATLPLISTNSKPVVGKIGDVRDASSPNRKLTFADFHVVQGYNTLKTNILKVNPYLYYTDNVKIWHTLTNIIADVVVWSKTDQTALMTSSPRGACPFPGGLTSLLVDGALCRIFRGSFNADQSPIYWSRWVAGLQAAFPDQMTATAARSVLE